MVAGEQCDDGNLVSQDGCSSTCKIENIGPVCGDGAIVGAEQCDDKNTKAGDGCSETCKIEASYECTGAPSACKKASQNHGMTVQSPPMYNMINIFTTLRTNRAFYFSNDDEMRNFMKFNFPDRSTIPDTVYCLQEPSQPSDFRCLLVYNSGLPLKKFDVDFSYNHKGETGFIKIPMDPLKSSFSSRSLK